MSGYTQIGSNFPSPCGRVALSSNRCQLSPRAQQTGQALRPLLASAQVVTPQGLLRVYHAPDRANIPPTTVLLAPGKTDAASLTEAQSPDDAHLAALFTGHRSPLAQSTILFWDFREGHQCQNLNACEFLLPTRHTTTEEVNPQGDDFTSSWKESA